MSTDALPLQTLLDQRERFAAFLAKRVQDATAAEDVLQDAYAKALTKARELREDESVVAWFYQVLRNGLIDQARRRDARARAEAAAAAGAGGGRGRDDLHDAVCACVTALLPHLRADQADLLRRVEIDGERVKDVADRLGITASAAAVRLHRARRALADALGAVCGVCAHHGCRDCRCRGQGAGSPGV